MSKFFKENGFCDVCGSEDPDFNGQHVPCETIARACNEIEQALGADGGLDFASVDYLYQLRRRFEVTCNTNVVAVARMAADQRSAAQTREWKRKREEADEAKRQLEEQEKAEARRLEAEWRTSMGFTIDDTTTHP